MMDEAASNAPTESVPAVDAEPRDSEETVLTQESNAVVPVSPPTTEKRSFWRRIAPARASRRADNEAATAQIEALAAQLAATEQAIVGRLESTEAKLDEVWEVEE